MSLNKNPGRTKKAKNDESYMRMSGIGTSSP